MDYWIEVGDESTFAKKYRLETEIRAMKQGNRSIIEFYNIMVGLWDQLADMEPSDLSKLSSYKKYREEQHLVQFLLALQDKFEPLRKSILKRIFWPTLEEAVGELQMEEGRLIFLSLNSAGRSGGLFGKVAKFALAHILGPPFLYVGDTNCHSGTSSNSLKIMSYNLQSERERELHERMAALGDLIHLHSPDIICFQEATPNIYDIIKQTIWWTKYCCLVSNEMAHSRPYFCMQLSKLPVRSFGCIPFRNARMGRDVCIAHIEVFGGKTLNVATSHFSSLCPAASAQDERVAQAVECFGLLKSRQNVIFCGDMDWDDVLGGLFPLSDGWIDAWEQLRQGERGWTYDTESNPMLMGDHLRPTQKRLDRCICNLHDLKLGKIDMIGNEGIPGLTYSKVMVVENRIRTLELPILPSDHYGLLLEISSQ